MSALVVAYGAEELKRASYRNGFVALGISILIHFFLIGCYYLAAILVADEAGGRKGKQKIIEVELPPFVPPGVYELPRGGGQKAPKAVVDGGTPVPVADDPVSMERTIPTQGEISPPSTGAGVDGASGGVAEGLGGAIDDDTPPKPFVAFEKEPMVVNAVQPVYPPLALRAGLEGMVIVKIWVDRQGKPRQVLIVKGDSDLFNEAALEAARQFVFTPAYMNNGPVAVWVSVPFKFRISSTK